MLLWFYLALSRIQILILALLLTTCFVFFSVASNNLEDLYHLNLQLVPFWCFIPLRSEDLAILKLLLFDNTVWGEWGKTVYPTWFECWRFLGWNYSAFWFLFMLVQKLNYIFAVCWSKVLYWRWHTSFNHFELIYHRIIKLLCDCWVLPVHLLLICSLLTLLFFIFLEDIALLDFLSIQLGLAIGLHLFESLMFEVSLSKLDILLFLFLS